METQIEPLVVTRKREKLDIRGLPAVQKAVLDGFMAYLVAMNKMPATKRRYEYSLCKFLSFAGTSFDFNTATKNDLEMIIGRMNNSGLADETRRKILISIKVLYKWLQGDGEEYPRLVRWIKARTTSRKKLPEDLFSEDEILRMIEATENIRDRAIIAVLWDTGCRVGELMNLRMKDVSLDQASISHLTLNGKTGMRHIPIALCVPYLARYLDTRGHVKEPEKPLWLSTGRWTAKEKPVTGAAVAKVLKIAKKKAGIGKHIFPHLIRHSRATYLAARFTEQQLKHFMGWTQSSSMAAIYVHLSGKDMDNAFLSVYGDKAVVKPEIRPSRKICPTCKELNGISAIHCSRCGAILDIANVVNIEDKERILNDALLEAIENPKIWKQLTKMLADRYRVKG